jgi:hypothetical protein
MVRSTLREDGEMAFKALQKETETQSEISHPNDDVRSKSQRLKELRVAKATAGDDKAASAEDDAQGQPLDLFMFKSVVKHGLHAFAGDAAGKQLPRRFRPWRAQGMIGRNEAPPHGLPRSEIEQSIRDTGYQLWRIRQQSSRQ